MKKRIEAMKRRAGPVGMSLAAAALTAVAFAAVSVAQDGGDKKGADRGTNESFEAGGMLGGPPMVHRVGGAPSEEDREAFEEFRSCMEDKGVDGPPVPPMPGEPGENGEMPDPPARPEMPDAAERVKIREAFEACKDKLPEGVHLAVPGAGIGDCGPPEEARKGSETAPEAGAEGA